ncbi:Cell division cycle-associated 7-like protein [Ananas comosus]|uniref:Cell division cycle-associated 7-like protein n=1 Tax=Ananas comosus TaxID=4615 RepID=A0A199ULV3_ANACO|nr:Cell division cycle-associated 7-like protein [Ananas comosus]
MAITPRKPPINKISKTGKEEEEEEEEEEQQQQHRQDASAKPRKRTASAGVRVKSGRIYDPVHGKTCHQCRQKTRDFAASCKQINKGNKACTINFCHKCLRNRLLLILRLIFPIDDVLLLWPFGFTLVDGDGMEIRIVRYGENAEEMAVLDNWSCPKCRGICNCSFCMKKRGHKPTGILVHAAKATGCSSVLELLDNKGLQILDAVNSVSNASPNNSPALSKGLVGRNNENYDVERKEKKTMPGTGEERGCVFNKEKKTKLVKKLKMESRRKRSIIDCEKCHVKEEEVNMLEIDLNEVPVGPSKKKRRLAGKSQLQVARDCANVKVPMAQKDFDSTWDKCDILGVTNNLVNDIINAETKTSPMKEAIVLPQGNPLAEVAGVELPLEDVGPALQFMEFCTTFSKVLNIRKGLPESILQEITRGFAQRQCVFPAVVQFHTNLLSIILKDRGKKPLSSSARSGDAWLKTLGKCISESQCCLSKLSLEFLNNGLVGYDNLDVSGKLNVLNFLCDETLNTEKLRSWIDKENAKFVEERKVAKGKVLAAKRKVKDLKEKVKNDVASLMLSQREGKEITISEHEDLILKIKEEAEKARAEMLNTMALFPKSTPLDSLLFVLPDCLLAVFLLNISMQSQCMLAYN